MLTQPVAIHQPGPHATAADKPEQAAAETRPTEAMPPESHPGPPGVDAGGLTPASHQAGEPKQAGGPNETRDNRDDTPTRVPQASAIPSDVVSRETTQAEAESAGYAAKDHTGDSDADTDADAGSTPAADSRLAYLPIDQLKPNPHQPRQHFDEQALRELGQSILQHGLMQPILVRPTPPGIGPAPRIGPAHGADTPPSDASDRSPAAATTSETDPTARYQIIAGERRWRAAQLVGLERLPAVVQDASDQASAELALVENLQRTDLNPLERAHALRRLLDDFDLTHDQVADRVGLSRPNVSNLLRLIYLTNFCQDWVNRGQLSMGHARALLGLSDAAAQDVLARETLRLGWSVRRLEQEVRRRVRSSDTTAATNDNTAPSPASPTATDALYGDLERQMAEQLGMRVKLRKGRRKHTGSITIEFATLDQFDDLVTKLGVDLS